MTKKEKEDSLKMQYKTIVKSIYWWESELSNIYSFFENYKKILIAINPVIPHFSNECMEMINVKENILWPKVDEKYLLEDNIKFIVQFNGKTRKIITSNYKKITNFITVLYKIKDKYVEADGTLSKQAQSDISIFGVSSNTSEDPQGTTTTADVTREVMLAIKNEWISKDKDSISARVNKLCGKGVFRQETRDKLTQIIYNRFTDEDKVLPWSEAAVKVWREENKFKDVDWKEPKKVGNKEYDGIIYVIVSSSTLEKSVGVVARIAKDKDMPGLTRIYKEIQKNKEFSNQIQESRRIGAQSYIENAMEELEHADNRNIMIVREKVQLAKWLASKLIPVYGDKQEIKQETKIEIAWSSNKDNVVDVTADDTEMVITEAAKT